MGLLNSFLEYFHDISVFILGSSTGSWGTAEKVYGTADRVISGYIQPRSESQIFKNQSVDQVSTHTLYVKNDVTLNTTDRLVYDGENYTIVSNVKNGVANISDHKEIGLVIV